MKDEVVDFFQIGRKSYNENTLSPSTSFCITVNSPSTTGQDLRNNGQGAQLRPPWRSCISGNRTKLPFLLVKDDRIFPFHMGQPNILNRKV